MGKWYIFNLISFIFKTWLSSSCMFFSAFYFLLPIWFILSFKLIWVSFFLIQVGFINGWDSKNKHCSLQQILLRKEGRKDEDEEISIVTNTQSIIIKLGYFFIESFSVKSWKKNVWYVLNFTKIVEFLGYLRQNRTKIPDFVIFLNASIYLSV